MMEEALIIGSTCSDVVRLGEALDLRFFYKNEDGSPINLTSSEVVVSSSSPGEIKDRAEVSIIDGPAGAVRVFLSAEDTLYLRLGPGNRFRLLATFGTGSNDLSPEIYVQVTP